MMPRKRARSPSGAAAGAAGAAGAAQDKPRSDIDDDDFLFDETQSLSGRSSQEPQHRNAANARERARMRVLSKAFCRLKTTLPWVPADTKLSKLDTLRLAASYIAHLRALLHDEPRAAAQLFPHPLNLAWPFAFQHGGSSGAQCSASPRSGWSPPQSESPSPHTGDTSRENINMSTENVNISRENLNLHRENMNISRDTLITRGSVNCQKPNVVGDFTGSCYSNEMAGNETNCDSNVQYCNNSYAYRDGYYELRNCYSDSILNNHQ